MDIGEALTSAIESSLPPVSPEAVAPDEGEEDLGGETSDTADDQTTDDGDTDGDSLPQGYVAIPTVTDALATEFTLRDADGEVEVPELMVEYKANGKVRTDRLDQVVKLAQWGVYNQEREAKVAQVEQTIAQERADREAIYQQLAERESQLERLLTDDDFLYAVREAYENENSPERRAERAESAVENLRVSQQMEGIAQNGVQFYEREVLPAIEMISTALPHITQDELSEKVAQALQAHVERAPNGQPYVPPSRYEAVRKYIIDELAVWAQYHNARRQPAAAPNTKVQAELDRARVEAQKAKRVVGQTLKPVGRAERDTSRKPSAKPATVDDAVSSALEHVLSSVR